MGLRALDFAQVADRRKARSVAVNIEGPTSMAVSLNASQVGIRKEDDATLQLTADTMLEDELHDELHHCH